MPCTQIPLLSVTAFAMQDTPALWLMQPQEEPLWHEKGTGGRDRLGPGRDLRAPAFGDAAHRAMRFHAGLGPGPGAGGYYPPRNMHYPSGEAPTCFNVELVFVMFAPLCTCLA